jgi:hypothetical protein
MQLRRTSIALGITSALALAMVGAGAGVVLAQAPAKPPQQNSIDPASGSFEVNGVMIDVRGKDANAARQGGWRLAQRKGWEMLSQRLTGHSSTMSDGALDAMVTGIVVENEQIGPTRYIAKLGVLFDRAKAGAILGVAVQVMRSPPMLLVPVEWSGGTGHVFERDTAWQRAWTRFHGGASIDYVKIKGNGPDALLVNAGQIGRRGRGWWREVLDRYGARDVLTAEVRLRRDYPGGPVTALFLATHGPDRQKIAQFALRVDSSDGLDAMLDQGVQKMDQAFQDALSSGVLKTDALLAYRPPEAVAETPADEATPTTTPTPEASQTTATFTVQVETPSASALIASEGAIRGIPGVRSAQTTSTALGGISVMSVSYDGPIGSLRAALEGRGWSVQEGANVLRIRRPEARPNPTPTAKPDGG